MTYEEFENTLVPHEPYAVTYVAMEEAERLGTTGKGCDRVNGLMVTLEEQMTHNQNAVPDVNRERQK